MKEGQHSYLPSPLRSLSAWVQPSPHLRSRSSNSHRHCQTNSDEGREHSRYELPDESAFCSKRGLATHTMIQLPLIPSWPKPLLHAVSLLPNMITTVIGASDCAELIIAIMRIFFHALAFFGPSLSYNNCS